MNTLDTKTIALNSLKIIMMIVIVSQLIYVACIIYYGHKPVWTYCHVIEHKNINDRYYSIKVRRYDNDMVVKAVGLKSKYKILIDDRYGRIDEHDIEHSGRSKKVIEYCNNFSILQFSVLLTIVMTLPITMADEF